MPYFVKLVKKNLNFLHQVGSFWLKSQAKKKRESINKMILALKKRASAQKN